jgi:hypothetical protein
MTDLGLPHTEHLIVYGAAALAACAALTAALLLIGQLGAQRGREASLPDGGLPKALFAAGLVLGALAIVQVMSG